MKKIFWTCVALACIAFTGYVLMQPNVGPLENISSQKIDMSRHVARQEKTIPSAAVVTGEGVLSNNRPIAAAPSKTPAQRLRNGDRLAQLHAELTAGTEGLPAAQYVAKKIVEECLLTSRMDEGTYVPLNENTRAMAVSSLRKLKESCAGLDMSSSALARLAEQKKFALEKGDPAAMADETLILAARGNKADAFEVGRSLLKKSPDDPDVWQTMIGMLPALGIPIGAGDEQLRQFTPEQIAAATMLSACESTSSCSFNDSVFLQNECVIGGRCSNTVLDYIREFVLPPSEVSRVPAAAARLTELISERRWDLIGYAQANRPVQTRPSVLPPPPKR